MTEQLTLSLDVLIKALHYPEQYCHIPRRKEVILSGKWSHLLCKPYLDLSRVYSYFSGDTGFPKSIQEQHYIMGLGLWTQFRLSEAHAGKYSSLSLFTLQGFPGGSGGKDSACNVGDPGSILGLRRFPGEGNGKPFWYSCLENPMDGGAWKATVHGVAKNQTRLSDFTIPSFCTKIRCFSCHWCFCK